MLSIGQIWTPALMNWFGGLTPAVLATLTCRQILESYRFIQSNSKAE